MADFRFLTVLRRGAGLYGDNFFAAPTAARAPQIANAGEAGLLAGADNDLAPAVEPDSPSKFGE